MAWEALPKGRGLLVTPTAISRVPTHGFIEGIQLEKEGNVLDCVRGLPQDI